MEIELYIRNLAAAVILQAAEDLWDEDYRKQSIDFFCDKGFRICAGLAEIPLLEQVRFLRMLKALMKEESGARKKFLTRPATETLH